MLSILIVILLSIVAWAVEESRGNRSEEAVSSFLSVLNEFDIEGGVAPQLTPALEASRPSRVLETKLVLTKNYRDVFSKTRSVSEITPNSICLNSIDSAGLEALPVFGPVLAGRTVKFRNLLGGFVVPMQLLDVYGFDSEKLSKVEPWFKCELDSVRKICVDTASWKSLKSHPYIGSSGATAITRFVKHNDLTNLAQLENMPQMNDSTWGRWEPYVKICDFD